MSTGQLTVLWWVGIALCLVCLAANNLVALGAVVIILGGISIFTMRPHPSANKRKLLKTVLRPVVLLVFAFAAIAVAISFYQTKGNAIERTLLIQIPVDQIRLFNQRLENVFDRAIYGSVQNNSGKELRMIDYAVSMENEKGETVFSKTLQIKCSVPAGQTGIFEVREGVPSSSELGGKVKWCGVAKTAYGK